MPVSDPTATDISGFCYRLDLQASRRQLTLSIVVVTAMSLIIAATALTIDVHPVTAPGAAAAVPHRSADRWLAPDARS